LKPVVSDEAQQAAALTLTSIPPTRKEILWNRDVPIRIAVKSRSGNVGFSALTAILVAVMPKCHFCWVALTSALGVGPVINSDWLQPLAVALLFLSLSALLVRARRRGGYGPFILGLAAADPRCHC
jgi:hypothetical protein